MPDLREIAGAHMRALVTRFGCYEAAEGLFQSRWGVGSKKGTISKKMSGQLDWTVAEVIAMEDAMSSYQVTRMMFSRLKSVAPPDGSLLDDGASIAKEAGEAVHAILCAEQSGNAGDRARAAAEISEAIVALETALTRLKARSAG